jgi:hypothetical protein
MVLSILSLSKLHAVGLDGRILLNWIIEKYGEVMCNEFI